MQNYKNIKNNINVDSKFNQTLRNKQFVFNFLKYKKNIIKRSIFDKIQY